MPYNNNSIIRFVEEVYLVSIVEQSLSSTTT